jgi:uncharacterized protein YebE (UPF0316 family)
MLSAVMAFFEALVFAVVMASIVADLRNILNLVAYCAGASVGSYVGMVLESRVIRTYSTVQVITHENGQALAEKLRACGYGVTETEGRGRDGMVSIVRSSVQSNDLPRIMAEIRRMIPGAFIEVENARTISRGTIPGMPPHTLMDR